MGGVMEAGEYFVESLIRDRLAEARTRARFAALYCQSHGGSADAKGIGRRLIELGRLLAKRRGPTRSKSPTGATGLPAPRSAR
jgi:hypothetical protein